MDVTRAYWDGKFMIPAGQNVLSIVVYGSPVYPAVTVVNVADGSLLIGSDMSWRCVSPNQRATHTLSGDSTRTVEQGTPDQVDWAAQSFPPVWGSRMVWSYPQAFRKPRPFRTLDRPIEFQARVSVSGVFPVSAILTAAVGGIANVYFDYVSVGSVVVTPFASSISLEIQPGSHLLSFVCRRTAASSPFLVFALTMMNGTVITYSTSYRVRVAPSVHAPLADVSSSSFRCGPGDHPSDCVALEALVNVSPTVLDKWVDLFGTSICSGWPGVECNRTSGRVRQAPHVLLPHPNCAALCRARRCFAPNITPSPFPGRRSSLRLPGSGIEGTIPNVLGLNFSSTVFSWLDLSENFLSGTIPSSLSLLQGLKALCV